jgi:phage/plasmid-like protein (TIGR03299 family)
MVMDNVESMAYYGETPWHGLGTNVQHVMTSDEAIKESGLDWPVEVRPIFAEANDKEEVVEVPFNKAIVRVTDEKPLGVVGPRYYPFQNNEAFDFFDSVVGEKKAIYHTCGSLNGGSRIWMLAKMPDDLVLKAGSSKDVIEKFLLLANSHDGSLAIRMFFTPIRVVCWNTLQMSLSKGRGDGVAIRHTKNAKQKVQEAERALKLTSDYYKRFGEKAEVLARTKFTEKQMLNVVTDLFPAKIDEDGEEDVSTRSQNKRDNVINLWENGKGIREFRGTAWAAVNSVVEFADHFSTVRSTRPDSRLNSMWFGSVLRFKEKGIDLIEKEMKKAA